MGGRPGHRRRGGGRTRPTRRSLPRPRRDSRPPARDASNRDRTQTPRGAPAAPGRAPGAAASATGPAGPSSRTRWRVPGSWRRTSASTTRQRSTTSGSADGPWRSPCGTPCAGSPRPVTSVRAPPAGPGRLDDGVPRGRRLHVPSALWDPTMSGAPHLPIDAAPGTAAIRALTVTHATSVRRQVTQRSGTMSKSPEAVLLGADCPLHEPVAGCTGHGVRKSDADVHEPSHVINERPLQPSPDQD